MALAKAAMEKTFTNWKGGIKMCNFYFYAPVERPDNDPDPACKSCGIPAMLEEAREAEEELERMEKNDGCWYDRNDNY